MTNLKVEAASPLPNTAVEDIPGPVLRSVVLADRTEVVADPARLHQLKTQWDALWARSLTGGIYQSFETCRNAWETIARPGGRSLFCLVGWQGERAVAIWPLTTFRQMAWRCLRPLEASGAEYSDLLLDPDLDAAHWLASALQIIRQRAHRDVMILPYVKAGSALRQALDAISKNALIDYEAGVCAPLGEETDWDSYYTSLSSTIRRKNRNARRKIEKLGPIRLETLPPGDPRGPQVIDWMLEQKRIWAERSHKPAPWVFSSGYRDFLVRLVNDSKALPKTFVFTLHAGDILLGVKLASAGRSLCEALIAAFNADYEKLSPGMILDEYYIHWAFDQKLFCDFGNGAERNKLFWSRHATIETSTFTVPLSLWGYGYLKAREWRRKRAANKQISAVHEAACDSTAEND